MKIPFNKVASCLTQFFYNSSHLRFGNTNRQHGIAIHAQSAPRKARPAQMIKNNNFQPKIWIIRQDALSLHTQNISTMTSRSCFLSFAQQHRKALIWVALYLMFILMSIRHLELPVAIATSTCTMLPMLVLWMLMDYQILPKLIHGRRGFFFLCTFLAIACLVPLAAHLDTLTYSFFGQYFDMEKRLISHILNNTSEQILLHSKYTFLLLSTAIVTSVSFLIDERNKLDQEFKEEQMQNRLKYLRAQINPHFLFNSLNCIYALTMAQDEKAPDSVLKLSEMLRYVIDDCGAEQVLLQKEVKYIRNYIDFQRIRMEREPDLTFECQVSDPNYMIPPMILQPMIENCFKHSRIIDDPRAWIHITLRQDATGLLFTAENSIPQGHAFSTKDDERTGIGLENVSQRLEMLFGDQCSFKTIDEKERYKTIVHIS